MFGLVALLTGNDASFLSCDQKMRLALKAYIRAFNDDCEPRVKKREVANSGKSASDRLKVAQATVVNSNTFSDTLSESDSSAPAIDGGADGGVAIL